MIKRKLLILALILFLSGQAAAQEWKPAGDKIKSRWAEKVDPAKPLAEYPRPQMKRDDWISLNGLWDYAIFNRGALKPEKFDGKILVPFAVESSLSGVQKTVGEDKELWYERSFEIPQAWKGQRILLNFGGVDWLTDVWINDVKIGQHKGGYDPFSFDISPFLKEAGEQKLLVRVWDPTDRSYQPRGKQVSNPGSIWYTAVTGIWQTVWLEPVNEKYIRNVHSVPDIDKNKLTVRVMADGVSDRDYFEVIAIEGNKAISRAIARAGEEAELPMSCLLYTSPSPRDRTRSRMPSSA